MYNKAEIMKQAWASTRAMGKSIADVYGGVHKLFAIMLKRAWAEAKANFDKPVRTEAEKQYDAAMGRWLRTRLSSDKEAVNMARSAVAFERGMV